MLENGLDKCTCPKTKCIRHGKFKECVEKHKGKNNLPHCKRKKTSLKRYSQRNNIFSLILPFFPFLNKGIK